MKSTKSYLLSVALPSSILIGSLSCGLSAEVKSLSSSELTETYIQDSTIIVTPKRRSGDTRRGSLSNITVTPVDLANEANQSIIESEEAIESDIEVANAEQARINAEYIASLDFNRLPSLEENVTIDFIDPRIPEPDFPDDPRFIIPEGDFEEVGSVDGLGISRQDDIFTLSIGNLPGIDPINLPYGGKEGPLEIIPRENGGFDLKIQIPQD